MPIHGYRRKCLFCGAWFVICRSCDRDHWHCSTECKTLARRRTWRTSTRKYRRTAHGRMTNRKAQRQHRMRVRKKLSVSQHSYAPTTPPCTMDPCPDGQGEMDPQVRREIFDVQQNDAASAPQTAIVYGIHPIARSETHSRSTRPACPDRQWPTRLACALQRCRVCGRVVTHFDVSDGISASASQREARGPPP